MKRKIALLATLLGGMIAMSAVYAGPTLWFQQLMGMGTEVTGQGYGRGYGYGRQSDVTAQESSGDIVPLMKVRAGVKKMCRNSKVIRRHGVVR